MKRSQVVIARSDPCPHYDIKDLNTGVKHSFGMATISTNNGGFGVKSGSATQMSRRSIPSHLRREKF